MKKIILAALMIGVAWPVAAQRPPLAVETAAPSVLRIDPARSEARFTVTKFGFDDVTGIFRESDGEIRFDPHRVEASSVRWRVRVASVLTDATNRDRSLQSPEYFDAARHPYLTFVSRAVRAGHAGAIEVTGDITIRGVTRPLTITVQPGTHAAGRTFTTDFEINRYDFGVVGGSVLGRLIGARVRVHLVAATSGQS